MIHVALVGAGGRSQAHVNALQQMEDVKVIAVVDPDPEAARARAAQVGARATYAGVEDLVAHEKPDAVISAVPYHIHKALTMPLIEARIPFFVEKPLASSLEDAGEIARAVEAAGIVTAVGYQWRYLDAVDRLRDELAETTPAQTIARYYWSLPPTMWARDASKSGGQLFAQVTHLYDVCRYLLGDVTEVYAKGVCLTREGAPGFKNWDNWTSVLQYQSGALGTFYSTYSLFRPIPRDLDVEITIIGDEKLFVFGPRSLRIWTQGLCQTWEYPEVDPTYRMDREFLNAVKAGDTSMPRSTVPDSLRTAVISFAAIWSNEQGVPIPLRDGLPVT